MHSKLIKGCYKLALYCFLDKARILEHFNLIYHLTCAISVLFWRYFTVLRNCLHGCYSLTFTQKCILFHFTFPSFFKFPSGSFFLLCLKILKFQSNADDFWLLLFSLTSQLPFFSLIFEGKMSFFLGYF